MISFVIGFLAAGLVLFAGGAAVLYRGVPPDRRGWRWFLTPLALYLAFSAIVLKWLSAPAMDWNAARLAVSLAFLKGAPIFGLPGHGPFLCAGYGPAGPWAFTPVALVSTPTCALLAGSLLSLTYYLAPATLLLLPRKGSPPQATPWAACVWCGCVAWTLTLSGLPYQAFGIHVDAPAVGFGALACWFLLRRREPSDPRYLAVSALCLILSAGSKQVEFPLLLGLPLYVLYVDGWRAAARYLLYLGLAGLAALCVWRRMYGLDDLLYWSLIVPLRFPTGPSFWENLANFAERAMWLLPWLVAGALVGAGSWRRAGGGLRTWLRANPWTLLLWAGLVVAPTSIRAMQLFNGSSNSLHCLYYWALAFSMLLFPNVLDAEPRGLRQALRALLILFVVSALAAQIVKHTKDLERENPAGYFTNSREVAFRYAKEHPGEAYFPWEILSSLLAEGRVYHFDYGVYAQELAGIPVDRRTQLEPYLPARMRLIAYKTTQRSRHMLRYFPEFSCRIALPELPGFDAFVRPSDPLAQAQPAAQGSQTPPGP